MYAVHLTSSHAPVISLPSSPPPLPPSPTQMIVERASAGDMDPVRHALDLLVDLLALFVRILVIVMRNQAKRDEQEQRRRDKKRSD